MTTTAETLAEALPREQARARELLAAYKKLGANGVFGAWVIEQALAAAEKASAEQDTVAMLKAYYALADLE